MLYVENFIRTESSRIGNIATCICKRLDPWRKYNMCLESISKQKILSNKVMYVVNRYVRAEVLAGFVNGLFLLFIGFFIFSEAIEVMILNL